MLVWENSKDVKKFYPILDKIEKISILAQSLKPLTRPVKECFKAWEYSFTYLWLKELSEELNLDRKLRVMDFGCGKSVYPEFLAQEGFEVWGVDNDIHSYIAPVRKEMDVYYPNAHYWIGEIFDFDLMKFDAIISCSVLEHLVPSEYRIQVLGKLRELLEVHGKMIHVVDFYFPDGLAAEGSRIDLYQLGKIFGFDTGDSAMCPGSPTFDFDSIKEKINFIAPTMRSMKPKRLLQARIAIGDDIK